MRHPVYRRISIFQLYSAQWAGKTNGLRTTSKESFSGAYAKLRQARISYVISVRPSEWDNSIPTRRIFGTFIVKPVEEIRTKISGTLQEDLQTICITDSDT